jgi:parvulin-like peptidyl-prolyl isomerase
MMRRRIHRNITVLAATAATFLLMCAAAPAEEAAVDYPVALVNSQKITKSDVDRRLARLAVLTPGRPAGQADFAQALDLEIQRVLILQAAEKELDQTYRDRIREMAKTLAGRETDAKTFKRTPTDKEVDAFYKDLLVQAYLRKKVLEPASVTPAEIKDYYDRHRQQFTEPATVTIREILIRPERHSAEEAKSLAEKAAARIAAGEDFAAVATEMSEGPYASSGGLWPPEGRGRLIPEVEAVAFAARPAEVSAPFKSAIGWHVVKVEEASAGRTKPYAEVQEEIQDNLIAAMRTEAQAQLIRSLKAKAVIKILSA